MLRQAVWTLTKTASPLIPRCALLQCMAMRRFMAEDADNGDKKVNPETEAIKKILVEKIDQLVKSRAIVLFMKGTAKEPLCGFSQYVSNLLAFYKIPKFNTVDVTVNPLLKDALKIYSKWPTIPQLFVKGKFVGGYDIVKEMHGSGALEALFKSEGLLLSEGADNKEPSEE